jgi:indole-3-glycerol phosphate synthase/phosphoribosylanthranilate isomerase
MENVLESILSDRKARVASTGPEEGCAVPKKREVPLVPFGLRPFLICEVKRRSPSKGDIAPDLDASDQAGRYAAAGVGSVSVLTEPTRFGGRLSDLVAVKRAMPGLSVLRKDFLFFLEDIEVSFRAGADAVLLIVSILDPETLALLHRRAAELGLAALVEVHSPEDIAKARAIGAPLVGLNSRNLATLEVDPCLPLKLKPLIDWKARLVYESGISSGEDAAFAIGAGFDGLLVGEAAVRNPALPASIVGVMTATETRYSRGSFWERLYRGWNPRRPLVKVCGITRRGDAELASRLGADVLGFVFAPSPRRAESGFVRSLGDLGPLKVAVVALKKGEVLSPEVLDLLESGSIDAVQFHGEEEADELRHFAFPWYKALRPRSKADLDHHYSSPRVLVDAWSESARGGTGKRLDDALVDAASGPIWLAGGLNPGNIAEVLDRHEPELVDLSSGLEEAPGVKSRDKMKDFFSIIGARHER